MYCKCTCEVAEHVVLLCLMLFNGAFAVDVVGAPEMRLHNRCSKYYGCANTLSTNTFFNTDFDCSFLKR